MNVFYKAPVHGRDGVREAAAWLNSQRKPDDLVVANNGLLLWSLAQYHDGPMEGLPESLDVREGYALYVPPNQPSIVPAQWDTLTREAVDAPRIWLAYLQASDPTGQLLQLMQGRYHMLEHRHYGFAEVYLFAATRASGVSSFRVPACGRLVDER